MKLGFITAIVLSVASTSAFAEDQKCVIMVDDDCITSVQLESGLSRLKALYELRASAAESSSNGLGRGFLAECADAASSYNTYITQKFADNHPNWETSVDPNRCYASKDNDSGFFLVVNAKRNYS